MVSDNTNAEDFTIDMVGGPNEPKVLPPEQENSIRKAHLFREGYNVGVTACVNEFLNGTLNLTHLDELREARSVTDFYSLGFEVGYLRKAAEIGLG